MTHDPRWHTVYARAKTPVKNYMAKAWLPWDPILMIRLWTSHGTWSACGPHLDHCVGNQKWAPTCLVVPFVAPMSCNLSG
jgi:hypothetical protein